MQENIGKQYYQTDMSFFCCKISGISIWIVDYHTCLSQSALRDCFFFATWLQKCFAACTRSYLKNLPPFWSQRSFNSCSKI